ncbi:MAG: polysaccharide lyase family 8 super-sandwich domain-containing protein [Rikenellaceae bacterium]
MKKFLTIISFLLFSIQFAGAYNTDATAADFAKFKQNIVEYYTLDQFVDNDNIEKIVMSASAEGSWADIDYNSRARSGWDPIIHAERMLQIASAYRSQKSPYYKSKTIADLYLKCIDYWLKMSPKSPNWWQGRIGVPKSVAPSLILMEDILNEEYRQKVRPIIQTSKIDMTGQNRVWLSGNVFLRGVFYGNSEEIIAASSEIRKEVVISIDGEGIQADNSYHQHGPQQQFGNYGLAYVGDVVKWAKIFSGTSCEYSEKQIKIVRDYILNGQQWVVWKGAMDINSLGRQWSVGAPAIRYKSLLSAVSIIKNVDNKYKTEYEKIENYKKTIGHTHFWCSDYTLKRTKDYFFTIKMCSDRVVGAESCNDEHLKGYYSGDGAALLYQSGKEYHDIAPLWDWRKQPGVTLAQSNEPFKILTWTGYHIESSFVGGVSDGVDGITAMHYTRDGVNADKSWFIFDDLIFCLGSGITSNLTSEITTSVNQLYTEGDIMTSQGVMTSDINASSSISWVWNNNIGYIFPQGGTISATNKHVAGSWNEISSKFSKDVVSSDIFTLWINHSKMPNNGKYCYIMAPNTTLTTTKSLSSNIDYKITNENSLQIVESNDKKFGGAVAYKAAKFELLDGMELSKPAIVFYKKDKKGLTLSIADPTRKLSEIVVTLSGEYQGNEAKTENGKTIVKVALPQGGNAGSTKSIELY